MNDVIIGQMLNQVESQDHVEEGAEKALRREIEFRLQQIDNGAVELISWCGARKRLRERLDC